MTRRARATPPWGGWHRIAIAGVAAALLALALALGAVPGGAAAPWLTVVYGDALDAPVAIRGWEENHAFGLSLGPPFQPDPDALEGRPSLVLAHYAGAQWAWLEEDAGGSLPDIGDASYYGRFFPAMGEAPAIVQIYEEGGLPAPVFRTQITVRGERVEVVTGRRALPVGARGLAILERRGVPTRADGPPPAEGSTGDGDPVVPAAALALAAGLVIAARVGTGRVGRRGARSSASGAFGVRPAVVRAPPPR